MGTTRLSILSFSPEHWQQAVSYRVTGVRPYTLSILHYAASQHCNSKCIHLYELLSTALA